MKTEPSTPETERLQPEGLVKIDTDTPLEAFLAVSGVIMLIFFMGIVQQGPAESLHEIFGEPIHVYTRAQAIADGVLIDLTSATDDKGQLLCKQAGFVVPVAITATAWHETVAAGGTWEPDGDGDVLKLSGGQSITGRLWDVLWLLRMACKRASGTDRVHFQVLVDTHGDGRHRATVGLWALIGPGDTVAPVITIMVEGED